MIYRKRSLLHFFVTTGVAAVTALGAACRFPGQEYEDYQKRTEGIRGLDPSVPDGGSTPDAEAPIVGAVPEEAISGFYLLECLSSIAGDVRQALKFRTIVDLTPGGSGSTLRLTLRPILTGATDLSNIDPASSDIAGPAVVVNDNGRFDIALGDVFVPDTSNSFSGAPLTVDDAQLLGVFFDGDKLCGRLTGLARGQTTVDLAAGRGTPCIATRYPASSGALPTRTIGEFRCTL